MIKKFKNFGKMNESRGDKEQKLVDNILDKISKFGYPNISKLEKEILNKASESGIESLSSYVDYSDDEVLSFDKHGHIMINDVPYTEWQMNKDDIRKEQKSKKKENDTTEWGNTTKGEKSKNDYKSNYRVRVYKNRDSSDLFYYLFFNTGEKKKFYSYEKGTPYGKMSGINSWVGKSLEEVHKQIEKDYDNFKDLDDKEISVFETFLSLRARYGKGKGKIDTENEERNNKLIIELDKLYKNIKNI